MGGDGGYRERKGHDITRKGWSAKSNYTRFKPKAGMFVEGCRISKHTRADPPKRPATRMKSLGTIRSFRPSPALRISARSASAKARDGFNPHLIAATSPDDPSARVRRRNAALRSPTFRTP